MNLLTETHNIEQLEFIENSLQEWLFGNIKLEDLERRFSTPAEAYTEIIVLRDMFEKYDKDTKESVYYEALLRGKIGKLVIDISFYIRQYNNLLPKKSK